MTAHGRRETRRLLVTGAAGGLGRVLQKTLRPHVAQLRLSDIQPLPEGFEADDFRACDLSVQAQVVALVQGCDAIVHLGGVSVERPFEEVLQANIRGVYHLYEAARIHGVQRIVFASSNHVSGFRRQGEATDVDDPKRPDGYYGLSKSYGEDLSRFYFDRYGIETACIRIGSAFAEAADRRMLSTWMSYEDLTELIRLCLSAPELGHQIFYGASANRDVWWSDRAEALLGFRPKDSSERFRAQAEARPALAADDPAAIYQGGVFVKAGPFG